MKKLFLLLTAIVSIALCASAQSRTVKGTVISAETNEPLIGATVLPVGGGNGVATDLDGNFTLTIPDKVTKVKVSYVGMRTATVDVAPNMTVALQVSDTSLDEVVVTGYGSGKKIGSVVGSVGLVGEAKLDKAVTPNFTDALQGQVAGLNVSFNSGDPSKTAYIRLRGVNSIFAGTTPLFILDGAPVSESVFNTLNPSDIEKITVLKDASAVAIYGSRAANGVLVITSKKGKFGEKANVTIRAQYGFSQMVDDQVEMMNSAQMIEFRDKIGQPVSQEARDAYEKYGIDTNWRDEIFDSSAPTYTLDASISGGSETFSYYMSLNHHDQQGIIAQSGLRRDALRLNLDARVNDWLKVGMHTNLGYTKYETNNEAEATGVYTVNPMVFARKAMPYDSPNYYTIDENGNIVWGDKAMYAHFTGQPTPDYFNDNRDYTKNRTTVNANIYEEITPIKGLVIRAQQALDAYDYRSTGIYFPTEDLVTPMGDSYPGDTGYHSESFTRYYAFTYTNTAEYRFNINKVHNISALLGQESIIMKSTGFGVYTEGHTDIRQIRLDQGTSVAMANVSESRTERTFNSFFFNGTYDYDSRYFFDFTFRRDGSSKFAPDHRWANFFAVGGMWDIKKEKFMEPIDWLDQLQLKVSYGETGNSSIDDYSFYGLIGSGGGYNGEGSIGISQPSNYDLTWETVGAFNLGLNFRVFDRVSANVDFYKKKTTDMLMPIPYSYTTGYTSGDGNIGAMTNTGFDLEVKADLYESKDWYWGARANVNYNKNEITELFAGRDEYAMPDYGLNFAVGHSSGELWYVRYAGVDPRDGKQMWYTKEGNLTKTYNEERDRVMIGKDMYAPWSGGFGTDVKWKNFSLSADFTWAADKYMWSNDRYFIENHKFNTSYNQTTAMLNVWTTPGQVTNIPKAGEVAQADDRYVEDASFLRLKNVTFQYMLPQSLTRKAQIDRVNFFFTGRNLLTFTKYTGYDPEPESNLVIFNYPNTRQYVFGVEVTF